jgi:hypothetical protein
MFLVLLFLFSSSLLLLLFHYFIIIIIIIITIIIIIIIIIIKPLQSQSPSYERALNCPSPNTEYVSSVSSQPKTLCINGQMYNITDSDSYGYGQ